LRGFCASTERVYYAEKGFPLAQGRSGKDTSSSSKKESWMPDPVTGYFVPEGHF
ncbi:hypothetical protein KI387_010021, partial [Taxus chinensis]